MRQIIRLRHTSSAMTPANMPTIFSLPPPIGNVSPSSAVFTNLQVTGAGAKTFDTINGVSYFSI